MQEMWNTINRQNLQIIVIDQGEEPQVNGRAQWHKSDFQQVLSRKLLQTKKDISIQKHTEPQLDKTKVPVADYS